MSSRIVQLVFAALAAKTEPLGNSCISDVSDTPKPGTSLLRRLSYRFLSDEEVAKQLQLGDTDALTCLFERHSQLLFRFARRILRNDAEAEDTVQQVFLDVFRSIQQFNPKKADFKTWLLMIGYHRTLNRRRHLSAIGFFAMEPLDEVLPELISGAQRISAYSHVETGILIRQILGQLQPRQRRTIEYVFYEGLTAEEISVRTGETVRVVRHNLYRGMEKLRKALFQAKGEKL